MAGSSTLFRPEEPLMLQTVSPHLWAVSSGMDLVSKLVDRRDRGNTWLAQDVA